MPSRTQRLVEDFFGDRVLRQLLAQLRGLRGRLLERDVELVGDHLGQPVGVGVGEVVDPRDVADHHLGAERAVGDDVGHAGVAVLAPHVVDHLAAPAHAKVDVEVGRGNPLGVEEALEEQLEADRIEVGDPQQIGDQAARPGAAPRPHGDALAARPVDEIPHDEEVVDEARLGDDLQLVGEALAEHRGEVVRHGLDSVRRGAVGDAITFLQAAHAQVEEVAGAVGLHLRRQGILRVALAALGQRDLQVAHLGHGLGVDDRLRHLRERPLHLGPRLQVKLLAVEAHALFVLELGAGLDAEHGVVRSGVARVHIVDVVGADHRQPEFLGQLEEPGDDLPLLGQAVVLHFDEVVLAAEDLHEPGAGLSRVLEALVQKVLRHQRGEAAGEADQPGGVLGQRLEIGPGLVVEALQMGVGHQFEQVLVARQIGGEQAEVVVALALLRPAVAIQARAFGQVQLAAQQRLDPFGLGRVVELDRAEEISMVGHRQGLHAQLGRAIDQPVDPARAVEQAVVGMDVKVDETRVCGRHGQSVNTNGARAVASAKAGPPSNPARHPIRPQAALETAIGAMNKAAQD